MSDAHNRLHGHYIEDLEAGMSTALSKVFSERDVRMYAEVSTDTNPLHLDESFAACTRVGGRVLHGMITASLVSAIIGTRLPGPGCLWMGLEIRFLAPVRIGETVHARAAITEIDRDKQHARLAVECSAGDARVLEGSCLAWVPSRDAPAGATRV